MRKRIMCMLMALCMIASLLPFTAAAADIVDSGNCGENVTWTLDSNGLLTISGTGKMGSYGSGSFHQYSKEQVHSVVINPGVTCIGNGWFTGCFNLKSITIPNSVTEISQMAFENCTSLKKVVIPDGVESIQWGTFRGCKNLIDVTIPNSVEYLSVEAFANCTSLNSITLPNSLETIGEGAFFGCTSLNNVLIPSSVNRILDCAFYGCTRLEEVIIPNSVSEIRRGAFENCIALKVVTLPKSGTNLGEGAFSGCTALEIVYGLNNSWVQAHCFENCTSLKEVDVWGVSGSDVFKDCTGLEKVTIHAVSGQYANSLDANIFGGCSNLKEVRVPISLKEVASNAFRGADMLADVYYCGSQKEWNAVAIKETGNSALLNATIHLEAHEWDDGEVTQQPTETTEGSKTFTCSFCGDIRTEIIPKLKPSASTNPFVDVKQIEYYYDPVLWAVNYQPQITNGTSATTFSPDSTCTRGQVVTFLWRAKGCPNPKMKMNPFSDVPTDQYYYKAVLWAVENGITNGTSPTTFSPDAPCTRAHVVTFLWRAEGQPEASGSNPFSDIPSGQYYTSAVLWAVSKNITNGTSATTFSPDAPCTRGQIVTFLYRDMK